MYRLKTQHIYSQTFLRSPPLVSKLVTDAGFTKSDTVIEIGPGEGIITSVLAQKVGKVIAVEADPVLASRLREKFLSSDNVSIYADDIRQFLLPQTPYKVFSNVPFNLAGEVMYKLLYYSHPPEKAYLIMQKEAAQRFAGTHKETTFSLLAKVDFNLSIGHTFQRTDFSPVPHVDIVELKVQKRKVPIFTTNEAMKYKAFIKYAMSRWKKDLKVGLSNLFTYNQWKRLAHDNRFNIHAKPTDLSFEQWIAIFQYLQIGVEEKKKKVISQNI